MSLWRNIPVLAALAVIGLFSETHAQTGRTAERHDAVVGRQPVLMISIDGLRPDVVLQADSHGQKIPVLRSFLTKGSYAQAVINVNPTVTNPNHTTLVTGVLPAEHGIYNNRPFEPSEKGAKTYSRYAQIKAPTLWKAAKSAGLTTASLFWPVTTDAKDIDYNVLDGNDEENRKIADDAIALIAQKRPDLMTVHFVALDHEAHEHGPDSVQAKAALEDIDTAIGRVMAAQLANRPDSVVIIVSDHGFSTLAYKVNLNVPLVEAGFITLREGPEHEVASWKAFIWYVGGMGMAVLHDPKDQQTRKDLEAYLEKLAENSESGIEHIYSRNEFTGLAPNVEFVIALKPEYRMGTALTGALRSDFQGGAHGGFTTRTIRPDMHSSFFIMGDGVAKGQNLGVIDMRQIAPTVAGKLRIALPTAEKQSVASKKE